MEHRIWTMAPAVALAAGGAVVASTQDAKDGIVADIAQYHETLANDNPAKLWGAVDEKLWKKPVGPKQASLETCDLGLGPGVVKSACAKLPHFFKDTDHMMDAEQRLMYCRMTLQGLTEEEASARPFLSPGKASDIEQLMAYIVSESHGVVVNVPLVHPEEKCAYELGRRVPFYRDGVCGFVCATCHAQPSLRIRLQELPDPLTVDSARFVYFTWSGHRVSQGKVRTMQYRLYDCLHQQHFPEPLYGSGVITALETFLTQNANGGKMNAPSTKR